MKKTVLIVSVLFLMLPVTLCMALFASAEDVIYSDKLGDLTWELNATTGELVISGEGEMASLADDNPSSWLVHADLIQTVLIKEGVTSIGNHAFKHCKNLSSVTIPDIVTSIGYLSFWYCNKLTEITIPNTCTYVSDGAFSQCENIATITMPSAALDALPQFGVKYLTLTDGTSVPASAFIDRTGLVSVTLPDTITSIGNFAFYNCVSLTSLNLPDGVTSIGYQAFQNCWSLESINITEAVTSIGTQAFNGCKKLTSITIPKSMTTIVRQMFDGCESLTSITIPETVTTIESRAFYGCHGLTEVVIPENVTSISDHAFANCAGLKKIVIPDGIQGISGYAFQSTLNVETVVTPINAVFRIPKESLKTVIFTSGTKIADTAFENCKTLERVIFCGTESEWKSLQTDKKWMESLEDVTFSYHDCSWETTDATHTGTCSMCEAVIESAHVWDGGTVTTPATHFETGVKTYGCTVCGEGKTAVLDKTQTHQYGKWSEYDDKQHQKSCVCGQVTYANHAYGAWKVITPATEESEGMREKTCTCGHKISETLPILTHDYGDKVTAPTCTEQGYTTYTCKNCEDSYLDTYTEATGHRYDGDTDATCNECGEIREIATEQTSVGEEAPKATEDKASGCGATLASRAALTVLLVGAATGFACKKKEE